MARYGREPHELKIIPVRVNVAETKQEALALYRELNALVSPTLGVQYLSSMVKEDLSRYPLDGPLPDLSAEVNGITSRRRSVWEMASRENLTIRRTYGRLLAVEGTPPFTGTAAEVADEMEDWFRSGACDGFMLSVPTLPLGLERVVDLLIPELQRRGIFHDDYSGPRCAKSSACGCPATPARTCDPTDQRPGALPISLRPARTARFRDHEYLGAVARLSQKPWCPGDHRWLRSVSRAAIYFVLSFCQFVLNSIADVS